MPVQVPPGHVVQQIVDESGTLRHVILSPQHPASLVLPPSHNPPHYVSKKNRYFLIVDIANSSKVKVAISLVNLPTISMQEVVGDVGQVRYIVNKPTLIRVLMTGW